MTSFHSGPGWLSLPALALLAACAPQPQPVAEQPFPRDTLVVAYKSDVESLVSVLPQTTADTDILGVLDSLLLQPGFDCELTYEPLIAESWSFSEDGKTLSLALKQGFTWTDGAPLTARDVKFTYDLLANPAVASPRAAFIQHMLPEARPRLVDDWHLEFAYSSAYDPATMVAHAVGLELLPEHALRDLPPEEIGGIWKEEPPLTYGPWRLESRTPGQKLVLVPNERWGGPESMRPKLRRVIVKVLPEQATQLGELRAGTVDMVLGVEVEDAQRLAAENPEIQLLRRGWRAMEYIGWNAIDGARYQELLVAAGEGARPDPASAGPHPIFGDPAVRRALTMALDIDGMMAQLFTAQATGETYAQRAVGTISPSLCRYHAEDIQPLPHAPEKASAALAAAGWEDRDGDGVLDKDGQPLRFRLLGSRGNARRERTALLAQDALKKIGVDMQLELADFGTYVQRAIGKDFDALIGGWSADLFVDPTTKWHSSPEQIYNFVSYGDTEADALIAAGLSEPDPEQAAQIWRQFQRRVYQDQPYTFLWWADEIVAIHGRFQDVTPNVLSPFHDLHAWWVPATQVKHPN